MNGQTRSAAPADNQTSHYYGAANRNAWRLANIASCESGRERRTPGGESRNAAGSAFQPYCTCFIDRVMARHATGELEELQFGVREQAVAATCARENGLPPDPRVTEDVGGPFPDQGF